jgi:hypothetical protein
MADSYTKALLHMNGTDASTTFTDAIGKTWTAAGNAQIDTAQSKFGGASGLFDGTGDYIDTPDHDDFTFGSGDFTIDLWLKRAADGVTQYFGGQGDSSATNSTTSFQCGVLDTNKLKFYFMWGAGGADYSESTSSGNILTAANWHHIAYVRYGNTFTQYVNGTADGTIDVTGKTMNNSTNKFAFGRIGEYASNTWNGWLDEIRVSKGIARWTTNFTPPTRAYDTAGGFFF